MGKGDKKTAKGKRYTGSHGVVRPKSNKAAKKAATPKTPVAKKAPVAKAPVAKAPAKKAAAKKDA